MMIVLSYSSYKNGIISNFLWFPILKLPQEFRSKLTISYLIFLSFWSHSKLAKISVFRHFSLFPFFCEIGQKWWEALKILNAVLFGIDRNFWSNPNLLNIVPPFCYWKNIIISGYNLSRLSEGHFLSIKPVLSAWSTLDQLANIPFLYPKMVF